MPDSAPTVQIVPDAEPMAYIGRAPGCGCVRMAIVDTPQRQREVAREVAKAIRLGETVERVTCEYVRTIPWTNPDCAEHAPKPKAPKVAPARQEALL